MTKKSNDGFPYTLWVSQGGTAQGLLRRCSVSLSSRFGVRTRRVTDIGRPPNTSLPYIFKEGECLQSFLDSGLVILSSITIFPAIQRTPTVVPIAEDHVGPPKMRFLCLHGKGTSARIFKSQTGMQNPLFSLSAIYHRM
jgi:hypothetical protein